MIKEMIKFDGSREPFIAEKAKKWGQWAAKNLGERVDWESILLDTVNECSNVISTQDFQKKMIEVALRGESWPHYLMAGRLYAPLIKKQAFGNKTPTIREVHLGLADRGFMYLLDYSEAEYALAEELINHKLDNEYPHFRLEYIYKKYALQNRNTGEIFETPQFVYMRMAMALSEDQPADRRMEDVRGWYEEFSSGRLNAPTPNFVNLGTPLSGFASCCIYTNEDTAKSIGIGLHIAYTMTYMSAGCGSNLDTRSIGDPVRGGFIQHQGKLPYLRATKAMVEANLQNGRGGAENVSWSAFDPEGETLVALQNPMSVDTKKIRGIDYTMVVSKFIARFAARKGKLFRFNSHTAPDLYNAFYSGDTAKFEELYEKYEADPMFVKEYFNAREQVLLALNEAYETGRYYLSWADAMNYNTPFYDTIYATNLCVAPETLLLTDRGYQQISTLENQPVTVWNGEEWSQSVVVKTGVNQKLLKVTTDSGHEIDCTPYHKFYVFAGYGQPYVEVRAHQLQPGMKLAKFDLPVIQGTRQLDKAYVNGFYSGDGCLTPQGQRVYLYGSEKAVLAPFFPEGSNWTIQEQHNRLYKHYQDLQPKFFVPDASYTVQARLEWLAGYLDADGCVYRNGDNQQLTTASVEPGFLKALQLMLQTLGINSKIKLMREAGLHQMPLNDGSGNTGEFQCREVYRLLTNSVATQQLMQMGLPLRRLVVIPHNPNREGTHFIKVESVLDEGRVSDTFCLNEPKRHTVMFNGLLTGNCTEIMLPQASYQEMLDLYSTKDVGYIIFTTTDGSKYRLAANDKVWFADDTKRVVHPAKDLAENVRFKFLKDGLTYTVGEVLEFKPEPEVAMCNIGAVVPSEIHTDEQYARTMYYALLMVDVCIHKAHYELPHIGFTSKARMNAGIGIMGLATWMAKRKLRYSSQEGINAIHTLNETHYYHAITQSIKLGKERGNAPWIHLTKYPEGYLSMDTASPAIDDIITVGLERDWDPVRQALIDNEGMRFSCVVTHMPGESSSKASGQPNSQYPIRDLVMTKTDGNIVSRWAAPNGDLWGEYYESAWDVPAKYQTNLYAVGQKFTDQGISADKWRRLPPGETVGSTEMLDNFFYDTKMGLKSRYYQNSLTTMAKQLSSGETIMVEVRNTDTLVKADCGAGGCAM